jgi:hypothetical protein
MSGAQDNSSSIVKARCCWKQLQEQSGDIRVIAVDDNGPLLVHRLSMGLVQAWRRVMFGGGDRIWLELVSWKKEEPAR